MSKPIHNITSQLSNNLGFGTDCSDPKTGITISKWTGFPSVLFLLFNVVSQISRPPLRTDWHFLLHFGVYILVAAQRSLNDLSKAAKRSGTKFVRRIQRQSSFALPRKKPPVSIQFTQQRPIQRGTTFIKYLDLSCTLFTFYHFSFPRMDLRLVISSLSFISLQKIFNRFNFLF